MGSIVNLKKGESVPGDMILLDSSEIKDKEAVCYLDTQFFDGKTFLSKKKASSLTQRKQIKNKIYKS